MYKLLTIEYLFTYKIIIMLHISKEEREELIQGFGKKILAKNVVNVNIVRLNEDNYDEVRPELEKLFGESLTKFPAKEDILRLGIAGLFAGTVLYLDGELVDGVIYDPDGDYVNNRNLRTYYNGDEYYIANGIYGNCSELFSRNVRLSQLAYFD